MIKKRAFIWLYSLLFISSVSMAQDEPNLVVEQLSTDIMSSVQKYGGKQAKADQYYALVQAAMEDTVQFAYIAKGVMGKHAKRATNEQKKVFLTIFKRKLAVTLAKAIENYGDAKLETEKVTMDEKNPRKAYVSQKISNRDGVVRVIYTMGKWKSGWRIANLTLDSANLGQTYSSQFEQAMLKNGGDIDKTIAWWDKNG